MCCLYGVIVKQGSQLRLSAPSDGLLLYGSSTTTRNYYRQIYGLLSLQNALPYRRGEPIA